MKFFKSGVFGCFAVLGGVAILSLAHTLPPAQAQNLYVSPDGNDGERRSIYIPPKTTTQPRRNTNNAQRPIYTPQTQSRNAIPGYNPSKVRTKSLNEMSDLERIRQQNINSAVARAEANQRRIDAQTAATLADIERRRAEGIALHRQKMALKAALVSGNVPISGTNSGTPESAPQSRTVIQRQEKEKTAPRIFNIFR